ncbi:electron transfer flavoprotein subunit alpha/FixB family protein [Xanthovirga aplysinae]|uniref:electron transfer flavoprotein subunit alpha/FixB family protein n=1 Tax=Xanthovirga aplysinae TaxID=2529853 RepID=UPI0012BC691D|nr:electron transfer flavoprotein subunit alpha/FixB family protein [Xanthovirga aplysinae]MTI32115.1 electron transfer flavoprotein subunit alpha/FixB family protein [Xanthovirga aplysinae]
MSVLVFIESSEGEIRKSSLEAVSYAAALDRGEVIALAIGEAEESALAKAGISGASRVLHAKDEQLKEDNIMAYASVVAEAMEKENAEILVLAKSSLGDAVASRVAIKSNAALASNVVELPDFSAGFKVKRGIYTGKAFVNVDLKAEKKILAIKKNAVPLKEDGAPCAVDAFASTVNEADFALKITGVEKAEGEILLPEAEIVVSGGRGMKGPENWHILEDLAKSLGAATGCSKPVSDMEWRPHHEHVGQTGIKVSPNLYIAVGISGAIQHLAGVNSSKCLVVINKDPEAPFFKAADYGIVGDAFEIVPKLTAAIKALNA